MAKPRRSGLTGLAKEERGRDRFETNVEKSEDTIRNEPVEHMIMMDNEGNILYKTTDNKSDEVSPSAEMLAKFTDAVVSHNHPRGSCFSPQDIYVAMYYQLKQIRATTANNGTFVLQRIHKTGAPPREDYANFVYLYQEFRSSVSSEIQAGIFNGTIPYDMTVIRKIENERVSEFLTETAPKFGWRFRKER